MAKKECEDEGSHRDKKSRSAGQSPPVELFVGEEALKNTMMTGGGVQSARIGLGLLCGESCSRSPRRGISLTMASWEHGRMANVWKNTKKEKKGESNRLFSRRESRWSESRPIKESLGPTQTRVDRQPAHLGLLTRRGEGSPKSLKGNAWSAVERPKNRRLIENE